METIEKIYWRVGEVSEMLGIEIPKIRYWAKEFNLPLKRSRNHKNRMFTAKDIETIKRIRHLREVELYTIEGAKKKL